MGDRPFTDVVFGNRNGFLTILTEPLSLVQEPFIVRQVSYPTWSIAAITCSHLLGLFLQRILLQSVLTLQECLIFFGFLVCWMCVVGIPVVLFFFQ